MSPVGATRTRLEKASADNGFDLDGSVQGDWIRFASSQSRLNIWLKAQAEGCLTAAFSEVNVLRVLDNFGVCASDQLPVGSCGARTVEDFPTLHHLIRRAFHLSRTLPDELLHVFQSQTRGLPNSTEVERLGVQRVGQDVFRKGLMEYWEGRCAVSGLAVPELLRASHIKPWADCETDADRLDIFNGFLLAPHLDAAFDAGFISVTDEGDLLVADSLSTEAREILRLNGTLKLNGVRYEHQQYLVWHRCKVFRTGV